MDTTINERIGQLIKALNLTNNSFAKSIGKSSSTINYIVEGKTKPGFDLLDQVVSVYHSLNSDWLMRGEGQMFRQEEPQSERGDAYLIGVLKRMEDSFAKLSNQVEVKDKQIETKDRQIESLQRMLEVALGKFNDVAPDRSAIRQLSASTYRVQAA